MAHMLRWAKMSFKKLQLVHEKLTSGISLINTHFSSVEPYGRV